jgi:hypothetical protein
MASPASPPVHLWLDDRRRGWLRRIPWSTAGLDERFHPHEIFIQAALRVDTKGSRDAVPQPPAGRVVGHPDVDARAPVRCRFEVDDPGMCDRRTFDGSPREHLVPNHPRHLRVEFDRNAGRSGHPPV